MALKYKVGDKVIVRKDIVAGQHYKDGNGENLYFNLQMGKLRGSVLTIKEIFSGRYRVVENGWVWCDAFLEGLVIDAESEKPQQPAGSRYKVGDKVRVRIDLRADKSYLCENGTRLEHPQSLYCNDEMADRAGEVVTVESVADKEGFVYYTIKEDEWGWSAGMFSGLVERPKPTWIIEEEPPEETPQWTKPASEQLHTDWNWEDLF